MEKVRIDLRDLWRLNKYTYHITKGGYLRRGFRIDGKRKSIALHREIMGAVLGQTVDHIDGDVLNNSRANLRFCTPSQNNRNAKPRQATSKYKGVYRVINTTSKVWVSHIRIDGKRHHLGCFETEIEAARAYNVAALHHHKEFARLNDIPA